MTRIANDDLFVANVFRSALSIERQHLQTPLHRDGLRQEANLAVAGLVLDFSGNRQGFAIGAQRVAEIRRGADPDILADAECARKDWYALFDGRQIEDF